MKHLFLGLTLLVSTLSFAQANSEGLNGSLEITKIQIAECVPTAGLNKTIPAEATSHYDLQGAKTILDFMVCMSEDYILHKKDLSISTAEAARNGAYLVSGDEVDLNEFAKYVDSIMIIEAKNAQ